MKPVPFYDEDGITIYHGDCRDILPSLSGIIVTDPPYGISLDTDYTRFAGNSPSRDWIKPIEGDSEPFNPAHLVDRPCLLFGANYFADRLPLGRWMVWNKRDAGPERILADAELAWHNGPGKSVRVFNWFWVGCYRKGEMGHAVLHPTQKPVPVMRWCIETMGDHGTIIDPYMGSGTTLVAAKQLGRRAIGIEIEERYCEIAVQRLAQGVLAI